MYTKDVYDNVIHVIEEEIPLPEGWLHGRKTEDATDARCFLCHYLANAGLSSAQIQELTGLKKSTVNKHIAEFQNRVNMRNVTRNWRLQIDRRLECKTDSPNVHG